MAPKRGPGCPPISDTSQSEEGKEIERLRIENQRLQEEVARSISLGWRDCDICGKTHPGPCRWGQDGCYKCGQLGHYLKDCPQRAIRQSVPPAS